MKPEKLLILREAILEMIYAGPAEASNSQMEETLLESYQLGWQDGYETGHGIGQLSAKSAGGMPL